nr:NADH dehydrogenase subunit 2 [Alcedoecus sp.]
MNRLSFLVSMNLVMVMLMVSSPSWILMWFFMESTTFLFIPLLSKGGYVSVLNSWKYYIPQVWSSMLFVFSLLRESSSYSMIMNIMLFMSMMMKLGMYPFHGWTLQISEGMTWMEIFLLNSIQKVPPILILTKSNMSFFSLIMIGLSSVLMSSMLIFSFSIRNMFMISSSYNMSWLVISGSIGSTEMIFFIITYSLTLGMAIMSINYHSWSMESIISSLNEGMFIQFNKLTSILLLMGFPPLGMFLCKMEIIYLLLLNNMVLSSILLLSSVMAFFFYIKMAMTLLLNKESSLLPSSSVYMLLLSLTPWGVFYL